MRTLLSLVVIVSGACGSSGESEAAPRASATSQSSPAPSRTPAEAPRPATASVEHPSQRAPSAEERARALRFREALAEGRRLARADDQVGAIAAFRRALEAGNDPRARCELGWAWFRAGDLDEAAEQLDHALAGLRDESVPEERRATFAACLYNRGRVAEERGGRALAAQSYRRSLALRPNATVQRALEALGDVPETADECVQICVGPHPSREAMRDAMQVALLAHHASQELYCSEHGEDVQWGEERAADPAGPFIAAHMSVWEHGLCGSSPERSVGVVEAKLANGWWACGVLAALGSVNDSVSFTAGENARIAVHGSELAVRMFVYNYDEEGRGDCAGCMMEAEEAGRDIDGCMSSQDCDYEVVTPHEATVVVRGDRLAPLERACLVRQ